MTEQLTCQQRGYAGVITLTRSQQLNALSHGMIKTIYQQLLLWQQDNKIKHVLIQGEGRAFCAGGDIRHIHQLGPEGLADSSQFFADEYRLNYLIANYQKPYLALIDGLCFGGGIGVSLHGSHRLASERTQFAMPETAIGFYPDVGGSYLLTRCQGELGTYLALSGNRFDAASAKALGLIDGCYDSSNHDEFLQQLCDNEHLDETINRFSATTEQNPQLLQQQNLIDECFSGNDIGAILSRLDNAPADILIDARKQIKQASPTSLAITLHLLRQAKGDDIKTCLQREFNLTLHCLGGHDFYEGIRALLVDKDKSPRWQPAKVEQLDPSAIAAYFSPTDPKLELS